MIIKRRVTRQFVQIANEVVRDKRLSLEAHGLLHYLLSMPDTWEVNQSQLARYWSIGRDKCRRIFGELRGTGWASLERLQAEDGSFIGSRWIIGDECAAEVSPEALAQDDTDYDTDDETVETGPEVPAAPESQAPAARAQASDATDHTTENPAAGESGRRETRPTENPSLQERKTLQKEIFPTNTQAESVVEGADDDDGSPPPTWGQVLARWPRDNVVSPFACERLFAKLDDRHKRGCYDGMPPYLADCRAKGQSRLCDLRTFIDERRWEKFAGNGIRAGASLYIVRRGTPQQMRWREWFERNDPHRVKSFDRIMAMSGTYTARSEWPPPKDTAA
jgi:hypothetical protein